jgi:2-succinyl-5-enolpyruvyl-6-hydroxy-3-cyclohexene-1-carboxylate synthase
LPAQIARPIHLNICFDEPLLDAPILPLQFRADGSNLKAAAEESDLAPMSCPMQAPLVVVSTLPAAWRERTLKTLQKWRRPLYLEAPSGLRGRPELEEWTVRGGEKSLKASGYDGVIRIGTVPTLRLWRDLEKSDVPVAHFSHLPYSGLPREPRVHSLSQLDLVEARFKPWSASEREQDQRLFAAATELFALYPLSEPAWFHWLSQAIPAQARVFVGNSLPIREWDFAAIYRAETEIFANRGVNGIDGLISTFLGLANHDQSNWCVLGDLSALYDLSGLWPAKDWTGVELNLVIINNGGGKIFQRLFRNPQFENRHELNFKGWAEMWGWEYLQLHEPRPLPKAGRPRVIEIIPSEAQSESLWSAWEKL